MVFVPTPRDDIRMFTIFTMNSGEPTARQQQFQRAIHRRSSDRLARLLNIRIDLLCGKRSRILRDAPKQIAAGLSDTISFFTQLTYN
jgi:hypothetical protein